MQFEFTYPKSSSVHANANETAMSFAPDLGREPTFFKGDLATDHPELGLAFREAISALHDIVVSDLRFRPKDREAYQRWLAEQEDGDLAELAGELQGMQSRIGELNQELKSIRQRRNDMMGPFYEAQSRYFSYLYKRDKDAWFVLDPVITVHPDVLFFECFSQDESSYGRLSVGYEGFAKVGEFACGTTNVDYSSALYDEFQKIRSYKRTHFEVDPSGFEVQTGGDEAHKEVKIDLPDTWVRGFLQVNSAMLLPAAEIELHPMDLHAICNVLRRRKEIVGPRSMHYILEPDKPVRVRFDPWGTELEFPRSRYLGSDAQEIQVWGRRRLHVLERLIPVADRFRVLLLGKGMPSFYVAEMGHMHFTLGLSGWTANDWSANGNFDLLAPRAEVDSATAERVFAALREDWRADVTSLSNRLSLDRRVVLGALGIYTQNGRAIYDVVDNVYRARELTRDPLPMDQLRYDNPREQQAVEVVAAKRVSNVASRFRDGCLVVTGEVAGTRHQAYAPQLHLDADERIRDAKCSCNWHQQNQLRKGPCEHILALRLAFTRQLRGD